MKKRFVVCINSSVPEQDQMFISYLKENRLGWWHYLKNTWLVVDWNGTLKAGELRSKAKEIFNLQHNLVIEINAINDTWAGFGPSTNDRNMFDWLKKNWKK